MKIETYSCDECGKRRDSDANHWWSLTPEPTLHAGAANPLANYAQTAHGCLLIAPFGQGVGIYHVCGQQCAIAAISRFMSTGKLEK